MSDNQAAMRGCYLACDSIFWHLVELRSERGGVAGHRGAVHDNDKISDNGGQEYRVVERTERVELNGSRLESQFN
jgi:hypothetical protein